MADLGNRVRVEFTREVRTAHLHFGPGETWDTWDGRLIGDELRLDDSLIPTSHFRVVERWPEGAAAPPLTYEQYLATGRMISHDPEGFARRMIAAHANAEVPCDD